MKLFYIFWACIFIKSYNRIIYVCFTWSYCIWNDYDKKFVLKKLFRCLIHASKNVIVSNIQVYYIYFICRRYLWKIFKGPQKCWCRHWRYARNTWITPSRASPPLRLDSYVVPTKDHSPRTTKSITMIERPSKVIIVNQGTARISKLCVRNPIRCSISLPYVSPLIVPSSCRRDTKERRHNTWLSSLTKHYNAINTV